MTKRLKILDLFARFLVPALILLCAFPAHAHVERGQAAGFFTGLQHPWSGFDHILAILPEFDLRVFQNPTGNDFQKLTN